MENRFRRKWEIQFLIYAGIDEQIMIDVFLETPSKVDI